jgi:hypothetical protein
MVKSDGKIRSNSGVATFFLFFQQHRGINYAKKEKKILYFPLTRIK